MDGLIAGDRRHRPPQPQLTGRRWCMLVLVLGTIGLALAALVRVFGADGLTAIEVAMVILFALLLPWLSLSFWNAFIGFVLLKAHGSGLDRLVPLAGMGDDSLPVTARTALIMTLYNEDPADGFLRLRTTVQSLDATGFDDRFEIFVLSDTQSPAIAAAEERLFSDWQRTDERPERLHYRRRTRNTGYKAGNLQDFCKRWGKAFDFMIVLDIDSLMTAPTLLRLVRLMQRNPHVGIVQTLVTGLPAASPFPRIFQFGMRHGMRAYTLGSLWWQGDAGPYWGHNAIIRIAPFHLHCRLPALTGSPPFGGTILSHDQVEAVLMRRAGYHVRVLPIESGSFEENPPTLPDFIKRDLRWCQGNLQYVRLLGLPGLRPLGRLQLLLAILMYTSAPCWMASMVLGLVQAFAARQGWLTPSIEGAAADPLLPLLGWGLFAATMLMNFGPKLFGLADSLTSRRKRRAYGGGMRIAAGMGLELLLSVLLAPVLAVTQTLFIGRLLLGRPVRWTAQVRHGRRLGWMQASRQFWPQTSIGAGLGIILAVTMPSLLPWFAPILLGLVLAIPIAVVTADPRLGLWLAARRVCAIPEDINPPAEVRAVVPFLTDPPATDEPSMQRPAVASEM